MAKPTTKAEVLSLMRKSHQEFYNVLSRIPDERMDEIALYDNWTIKDLIAHIGAWQQSLAGRIAALRSNQPPEKVGEHDIDKTNAIFLERYRKTPLAEVRAMEAASFEALEQQVREASEAEIFEPHHFPSYQYALLAPIAGDTYEHYPDHLKDVRAWMRQNGLD
jgi:hypothetical protein